MAAAPEFAIDRDGIWYHRGVPIHREGMLRLFASMLCRQPDGSYFLEGPGQRVPVRVADAPFVVTEAHLEVDREPARLRLVTSTGSDTPVDCAHPLLLRPDAVRGERRLYHHLGDGLEALVHRNVFYRLAELARPDPTGERLGILSDGAFFPLE